MKKFDNGFSGELKGHFKVIKVQITEMKTFC